MATIHRIAPAVASHHSRRSGHGGGDDGGGWGCLVFIAVAMVIVITLCVL